MKLNIGAGTEKFEGFKNVDIDNTNFPDYVVDLEKHLPFPENSVEEIISNHCFEHINNLHGLMKELHRVCSPGAKLRIIVPYYRSAGAFSNPDHKRFYEETTMDFYKNLFYVKRVRRLPAIKSKVWLKDPLYMLDTLIRRIIGCCWFKRHEAIEFTLINKKEQEFVM